LEVTSVPEPGAPTKPDENMEVTFKDVKRDVFDKSCNRCHSSGNDWNASDYNKPEKVREVFNSMMTMVLFGKAMPPRQDPPKPLPKDLLDNEAMREDTNPNEITKDQKLLLYKCFLNGLKD